MNIPNIDSKAKLAVFLGLLLSIFSVYWEFKESESLTQKSMAVIAVQIPYIQTLRESEGEMQTENQALSNQLNQILLLRSKIIKDPKSAITSKSQYSNLFSKFDSIRKQSDTNFIKDNIKINEYKINHELKNAEYRMAEVSYSRYSDFRLWGTILGIVLFILGLLLWAEKDEFEKKLLLRQNIDRPTFSNNCQSCSKKFDSLVRYGNELDGTKNFHFCNSCYTNGQFTNANINLRDFLIEVRQELLAKGFSEKTQKKIEKKIRHLDRWKKNQYM